MTPDSVAADLLFAPACAEVHGHVALGGARFILPWSSVPSPPQSGKAFGPGRLPFPLPTRHVLSLASSRSHSAFLGLGLGTLRAAGQTPPPGPDVAHSGEMIRERPRRRRVYREGRHRGCRLETKMEVGDHRGAGAQLPILDSPPRHLGYRRPRDLYRTAVILPGLQLPTAGTFMSSCHPRSYLGLTAASLLTPGLQACPLHPGRLPWPSRDSGLAGASTIAALTTLCDPSTVSAVDPASPAHSRRSMSKLSGTMADERLPGHFSRTF